MEIFLRLVMKCNLFCFFKFSQDNKPVYFKIKSETFKCIDIFNIR